MRSSLTRRIHTPPPPPPPHVTPAQSGGQRDPAAVRPLLLWTRHDGDGRRQGCSGGSGDGGDADNDIMFRWGNGGMSVGFEVG